MSTTSLPPNQEILEDKIQRMWSLAMWNVKVGNGGWWEVCCASNTMLLQGSV